MEVISRRLDSTGEKRAVRLTIFIVRPFASGYSVVALRTVYFVALSNTDADASLDSRAATLSPALHRIVLMGVYFSETPVSVGLGSCGIVVRAHRATCAIVNSRRYRSNLSYLPMPTIACGKAFTKLLDARSRLKEIARELGEVQGQIDAASASACEKHDRLQRDWKQALEVFKAATDEFSATVKTLRNGVRAARS